MFYLKKKKNYKDNDDFNFYHNNYIKQQGCLAEWYKASG